MMLELASSSKSSRSVTLMPDVLGAAQCRIDDADLFLVNDYLRI